MVNVKRGGLGKRKIENVYRLMGLLERVISMYEAQNCKCIKWQG